MKVSQILLVTPLECRNISGGNLFEKEWTFGGSFLERLTFTGSDFRLKDFVVVVCSLVDLSTWLFSHPLLLIYLHHLNDHTLKVRRRSPKLELRYTM